MNPLSHVSSVSKTTLCALCWAWVVSLGTALVGWNIHAGYPGRAKVVGLLMVFGAAVYVADMVSTVVRRDRQAS